ncbi:hypothetical protein DFH08DRAFT_972163 [Mycena albidolilacea]|uniref:Uncharacterized protein n=1 Tax=Mycena albidolilacea TaxID=1033008 RepID=A0AAD6ZC26_9AGAR|nr:hypothetical protein DFH08DRAFT_972163 [Mycena albidolilacea]
MAIPGSIAGFKAENARGLFDDTTFIYKNAVYACLKPAAREQFKKEIGWYEVIDSQTGAYAALDIPILHKNGSAEYDIHTCFLNPVLMRLYAALIRGPNAAVVMLSSGGGEISTIPKTDNMERIHPIVRTEPGAIAASSVLAIWGKSMDVCLHPRGDHTNTDYAARFDEYLGILTAGLRNKSPSILHVFSEWDRILFPNAPAGDVDSEQGGGRGKSDGYQRATEAIQAERPVEDEPEGAREDFRGDGEDEGAASG